MIHADVLEKSKEVSVLEKEWLINVKEIVDINFVIVYIFRNLGSDHSVGHQVRDEDTRPGKELDSMVHQISIKESPIPYVRAHGKQQSMYGPLIVIPLDVPNAFS